MHSSPSDTYSGPQDPHNVRYYHRSPLDDFRDSVPAFRSLDLTFPSHTLGAYKIILLEHSRSSFSSNKGSLHLLEPMRRPGAFAAFYHPYVQWDSHSVDLTRGIGTSSTAWGVSTDDEFSFKIDGGSLLVSESSSEICSQTLAKL